MRFIVPFPGGSSPDLTGRVVAEHLAKVLGQPVVVDNRAGAGGNIGTDAIAKATDGHVIGLSINGPLTTAPALYPNLPYDPVKDLVAVSLLARGPQFLVVNNDLPVTDLPGFLAHVRANPGKLAFGSVGAGLGRASRHARPARRGPAGWRCCTSPIAASRRRRSTSSPGGSRR